MKVEDLQLFTSVVELGGFSAAANALDLPRGNVSRRIGLLETELNITLFYRTTRQLSLTCYGKSYYQEVRKALDTLENAHILAKSISESPSGKIKIGVIPEADEVISPILYAFQDLYPNVCLDIRNITNGFSDLYLQGLDLACHIGDIVDSNLVAKHVATFQSILVASPTYLERVTPPLSVSQLSEHNFLCYRLPNGQFVEFLDELSDKNKVVDVSGNILSTSIRVIKYGVINGKGIARLPRMIVNDEIKNGSLVHILPDVYSVKQDGWLLYPEKKGLSKATCLLIEFISNEISKLI